ncbi:MAG: D-alanyl-D-alanine carboxypeptidase/D-alanyl-D-alanine-endopeptidase [Actinomycetota bacterium]
MRNSGRLFGRTLSAIVVLCLTVSWAGVAEASSRPGSGLRSKILRSFRTSTAKIKAIEVSIDGLGTVVDLNGGTMMPPASTQKMYTAGAALDRLGQDSTFTTVVKTKGTLLPGGTLSGDLVLIGGGDPTLSSGTLDALAAQVAARPITHVTGTVLFDESRYDKARSGPAWKPYYVPGESGPLSALAVDEDSWRTDGDFLNSPAAANADRFKQDLVAHGVTVDGGVAEGSANQTDAVVGSASSAPIRSLVAAMNKPSDNFMAEMLTKELGSKIGNGDTATGAEAVSRVADALGVGRTTTADGSGLSSIDAASARNEVAWLKAMGSAPYATAFKESLPIACVDGTLKNRLCRTAAAGKVFAKTGSLPGIVTLAGYTTTASGRQVSFSFMIKGARNTTKARASIDKALVAITSFSR